MQKTQYLKEIVISATQKRNGTANVKKDVLKIQSWLCLYALQNPVAGTSTGIDGDFGPATETAVKKYQKALKMQETGIVDTTLFSQLCLPLNKAFTTQVKAKNLRDAIVEIAKNHLAQKAFEQQIFGQNNSGPWVRSYMDGNEGEEWYWCAGFVQTIIDQAASQFNKNFKTLMPLTYSCDTLALTAQQKKIFIKNSDIRSNPSLVKPGDIFLVQKSTNDWMHTGLITAVHDDIFETIEGNTNNDGSSNGNGVYARTRNFKQSKLDVFSIEPLTV